ncbi:MAG: hypothetical protein OEY85_05450 [Rhodospirillales bacterium]|nr:hypothetical protein [Rhodospirillales bacterium]
MSTHTYPLNAILGDYARAGAGLVLTGTPLFLPEPLSPWVFVVFMGLFIVFLFYGIRATLRHIRRISVNEHGISTTPIAGRELKWTDLERVKLSYYSTRRDNSGGWLQLNLTDGHASMNIESNINGFPEIAGKAARVATGKNLPLDAATIENFSILGISLESIPAHGGQS